MSSFLIHPDLKRIFNGEKNVDPYYWNKYQYLEKHNIFKGSDYIDLETNFDKSSLEENIRNIKQLVFETTDYCNLNCKYCSLERYSDITLGDYVGDTTDYSKSTIFVNTEKGEENLQQCNNLMLIEADMNSIISKSWHLTTPNSYNPNRTKVFSLLDKPWDYLEKKFFHKPSRFQLYKEAIVKKIYKLIHI